MSRNKFSTEFDYYKVLEVDRSSDSADIKKSFRTLSKIHHPDKGGDEEHFKKMQESYVVLMDTDARYHYDIYLLQYEKVGDATKITVPDWYEPNPHFKSEADADPDLEELGLWPDARYFQDIIDGDPDRPKTLGWHNREERRKSEKEESAPTKTDFNADDLVKMRRKDREEIEEKDRLKREKEYADQIFKEQTDQEQKLEDNKNAEEFRQKLEREIVEKKKKEGKSVFSDFVDKFDKMFRGGEE